MGALELGLIAVLLLLVLIALVVLIVILLMRGRRGRDGASGQPVPAPQDPFATVGEVAGDPRALKAGDMVEYLGVRYFVRGSLRLREGGFTWDEHLLEADTPQPAGQGPAQWTSGRKVWISVEEDPDLEVILWTGCEIGDLRPDGRVIVFDGVEYHREEHGSADYRGEGTTGMGGQGRVEYVDYQAPGGRRLSFERRVVNAPGESGGGGIWELSTGERVPHGTMTIYPGS